MKHIWTVLCQKSTIDVDSNQLSLFNCMEELSIVIDKTEAVGKNLAIPIEFQLVSYFTADDTSLAHLINLRIEIMDPSGKALNVFENSHQIKQGVARFRSRANISGMPVTDSGRYFFKIFQKTDSAGEFELISELPLDVKLSYKIMDGVNIAKK